MIGPNGAGKTTLFNMIAGAMAPDDGSIGFAGAPIDGLTSDAVCRRGIARTFQIVRPFPALSVEDNVIVGALLRRRDVGAARERAQALLRRLELFDKRDRLASTLTLPDRKRLEVARALATEPRLLLLDEVMAGLRPTETDRMVAIFKALNRETGLTILLIEHVMRAVMALASRVLVLDHGTAIAVWHAGSHRARSCGRAILSRRGDGMMLRAENLDVFYGDVQALDGVTLEIEEGAIVAIVGANGAGKTTLIRALGRDAPADARPDHFSRRRYFRLAEPSRLQSRHRSGRRGTAGISDAFGCGKSRRRRDAAARPRCACEEPRTRAQPVSRCLPSARASRPARCPAASSRCSPSRAA